MPYRDLHSQPFYKTTTTNLEIFEEYAEAWIQTLVMQPRFQKIRVFDLNDGPGYDKEGVAGSPIRRLTKIVSYPTDSLHTKTKIVLQSA